MDEAALRERFRRVHALLRRLWETRKGVKAGEKLYLAAIGEEEAAEIDPPLTRKEVREWTRDEPRRQAFYRPKQEWPGRNQISNAPGVRLNADLLDWSETTNVAANNGYRYVLFVQDPHTRYAYARAVRNKGPDTTRAMREILEESGTRATLKQVVHDKGPEFVSGAWKALMAEYGVIDPPEAHPCRSA